MKDRKPENSGRPRGDRTPEERSAKKEKPFSLKSREFVEAVVTAIIFVLVIRQYAAETFDIPTQSMKPTLLGAWEGAPGAGSPARHGDHLIADKLYYKHHPVERFDIALFKDPQPASNPADPRRMERRTLIKRIVGLPGETIEIRHGDLYVSNGALRGEIPEKPRGAQDAMWRDVFATDFGNPTDFMGKWNLSGPQSMATLKSERGLEIDARTTDKVVYSHAGPLDDTKPLPNPVGDLLIEAAVCPLDAGGAVELNIVEDGDRYTLRIPVDKGAASLRIEFAPGHVLREGLAADFAERMEADVSLPVGRTSAISLSNADDRIIARLDGREIFRAYAPVEPAYRDDTDFAGKRQAAQNRAALALDGCHVAMERLRLARDVYYTDALYLPAVTGRDGRIALPAKCGIFVMRDAELFTAIEKEGRLVRADGSPLPEGAQVVAGVPASSPMANATRGSYRVADGEYFAMGDNSPDSMDSRWWGGIPREFILGRAVFLFWPFPPFSDQFRPRLVR